MTKGNLTYTYGDNNHRNAVTAVSSPNTGMFHYSYDARGNMASRNGDTLSYDSRNKLSKMATQGGDEITYLYDYSGTRIKKSIKNSGVVSYTLFGGIYEIKLIPQEKGAHTLYMKGLQGELIAMQTRTDATLADNLTSPTTPFQKARGAVIQVIVYTKSMNRDSRNALLWMIVFAGVIIAGISLAKINNKYGFGLRFASSVAMLSILFTFANCNLLTSSKSGKEPWILFPSGDKSKTQSVNGGTTYHGGGNGFATGVIPVTGMYFVHSDHLGSVIMLTDGSGSPVTGPEGGGKSYISYKPYGEILRTDSGGPDISKFKYTGQEEDLESGLMYYKARYYDPYLARFLEADSVTNSNSLFGMNRYMYVEGNPVRFTDPSGHKLSAAQGWAISGYLLSGGKIEGAMAGYLQGKGIDKQRKRNDSFMHRAFTMENTHSKLYDKYIYAIGAYYLTNGDPEKVQAAYHWGDARDTKKKYKRQREQMFLNGFVQVVAGGLLAYFTDGIGAGTGYALITTGIGTMGSAYNGEYKDVKDKERLSTCIVTLDIYYEQSSKSSTGPLNNKSSQSGLNNPVVACQQSNSNVD